MRNQTRHVTELFGHPVTDTGLDWERVVTDQFCPFLGRACLKTRKSDASLAIGTCSASIGRAGPTIICPHRMIDGGKIFWDAQHLLTRHEPGNDYHLVREVQIPGGDVDYFLISAKGTKIADFVGIELQALDTTGSAWPQRQEALRRLGVSLLDAGESGTGLGLNWKMTAKTILVQLHHKLETFQTLGKHLVLVLQSSLLQYMQREFSFGHLNAATQADSLHFHSYDFAGSVEGLYKLHLRERLSTDVDGIATCLGLNVNANVELEALMELLESKISSETLFRLVPS